jgi:hypothetical protein
MLSRRSMIVSTSGCFLCVLFAIMGVHSPASGQKTPEIRLAGATQVEEIYVARSVPESNSPPSAFCAQARVGFSGATREGQYAFRSTATRASDGQIIATSVKTIGSIHLCTGPTSDAAISNFYGEGVFAGVPFRGIGDCHARKSNFPERGLFSFNCFLDLSGLPDPYVGGLLTTNSMQSLSPSGLPSVGTETEPPGYTQASIATVRLWKKRAAH